MKNKLWFENGSDILQDVSHKLALLRWKSVMKVTTRKHPIVHSVVLAFGIVLVWKGLWGFADMIIPGETVATYVVSLTLGALLLFIDDFQLEELK